MIRTLACLLLAIWPLDAGAYITAPVQTLGGLCGSTYVTVVRVEKFNREKGIIIYKKVKDLKGVYPRDQIRHAFDLQNTPQHKGLGDVPVRPNATDWKYALDWAEVGKTAVYFSLKYDPFGDFGHMYIDRCWYATMCPARDWDFWWAIYSDAALLTRWHCGTPTHLAAAVEQVLAGRTAVVPSLAGGTREDLRAGRGRIQGVKVSLGLGDFNLDRDRVPNWTPKEIPELIRELQHADQKVRLEALSGLSSSGAEGRPALPRVLQLLEDKDDDTRLAALTVLASIDPGHAKIPPAALPFLRNESPERRLRAAEFLPPSPDVAAAAASFLEDPDRAIRLRALAVLARLGPAAKGAVPALARSVQKDGSGTVRMRCADALAAIGPDARSARPALEAALQDPAMAQRPEVLSKLRETLERLKQ
jgi:hypothetical protein